MTASGLPYVATLRVYEPVEVLEAAGVEWACWADEPEGDPLTAPGTERAAGLAAATAVPPLVVPDRERDPVVLIEVDGAWFGSPAQLRLRCWRALESCRDSMPGPALDACWPSYVVSAAEREFADWRAGHPGAVPHTRTNPWEIPLAWFVPFSGGDRRLIRLDGAIATRRPALQRLYYLSPMAASRQRMARAAATLARNVGDGPLLDGVRDIGRWLEHFHPRSWVELDHGGLIDLAVDEDPAAVDSVLELQEALAALAEGDMEGAVQRYRRLVKRWRSYAQYAHLS
ncbi:MAG TPA: hypothetical protein VHV82_20320 [Sporichthyaceae bacterium]|jgi:hypothetical protein|nr:hypothetical protein [Sporichthyaceae bacterium]